MFIKSSQIMTSTEEHTSLDNLLHFIVWKEDNDISLGFTGYRWHTHADMLIGTFGDSEKIVVERFVHDLLNDKLVIAISRVKGEVQDIWITDDPATELKYTQTDEEIELRYWSGRKWQNE